MFYKALFPITSENNKLKNIQKFSDSIKNK